MENYIGRLLDNRYEILEMIGVGGMAVVYKALDHRLNRQVAVKVLKDEFTKNEEFHRRFRTESQAVAMLSHPNIVSVYDVSRAADADFIVMELIEGITLKQYLQKKTSLNWRETLHFSMQIARALDHAHNRGIIHRDIKPHNIMILKDGSIKVADFGIARIGSAQNTLTREALGSVHYISPEQAKGGRIDNRSDLYSLGVVMYEMLTGKTPYDGETPVSVAIQHINGEAKRPAELMSGIPLGLEQITMHAMTCEADARYSSAAEMVRDMEEFRKNPAMTFLFGAQSSSYVPQNQTAESKAAPQPKTGMPRTEAERYAAARAAKMGENRAAEERRAQRARREKELEEKKRRNTVIISVCAVAAVVMVIALIFILVSCSDGISLGGNKESTSNSELVDVPKFIGKRLSDIDPEDYPNLDVDVISVVEEYSNDYEAGFVMDQSPGAGEKVKTGRTIQLVVSKGAQIIEMPDLDGYTEAEAIRALQNLNIGIKTRIKDEIDSSVEEGCVVRTEPEAGQSLEREQEVVLYISLGEKKMPDLRGDTKSNAETRLKQLNIGLKVTFQEEESDEYEEDQVIRTNPAAGSDLNEGDEIILYISIGSKNTTVPDVTTKSLELAIQLLEAAELKYAVNEVYDEMVPQGYVISQSVLPDSKVEKDTIVIIDVSKGPEPTEESTEESTGDSTEPPTESTGEPSTEPSSEEPVQDSTEADPTTSDEVPNPETP